MSLSVCIRKAGDALHPDDKSAILARAAELRASGLKASAAAAQAVSEQFTAMQEAAKNAQKAWLSPAVAENAPAYTGGDEQGTGAAGTPTAPADNVRRAGGAVPRAITALAITDERQRVGHAPLIGATASSPRELAKLAQVFRDPRVETFRFFFTKGDEIVHATGVSSREPGEVGVIPPGMSEAEYYARLRETMQATGADGYYLLHNHPSGNPTPSRADHSMTEQIALAVPGMRAHVVINSNKFATIEAFVADRGQPNQYAWSTSEVTEHYFGEDELLKASKPSPVLGTPITSPNALAYLGKGLQKPGWVTVVGTGADGNVRMLAELPESDLTRTGTKKLLALSRRLRRQSGSMNLYVVGSSSAVSTFAVREGVRVGVLTDAIGDVGQSVRSVMPVSPEDRLSLVGPTREVRDGQAPPTFAPEDGGERADMAGAEATELDEMPAEFMAREPEGREVMQRAMNARRELRRILDAKTGDLFGASDAWGEARKALVEYLGRRPDDGFALEGTNGNGLRRILNASAQSPGQWQLTRFASDGEPWGDSQYRSKTEALDDFLQEVELDTLRDMDGPVARQEDAAYQAELNAGFDAEPEAPPRTVDDVRNRVFAEPPEPLRTKLFRGLRNMGTDAGRASLREYWAGLREHLLQQVFDSFRPLQKLSQRAYIAARMSTASEGTLEAFLSFGKVFLDGDTPDVEFDGNGGFLGEMAKLQGEHQRFLQWVAALRAEKLKAERRENLMDDADIAVLKTLDQGDMPDGANRADAYRQALAALTEYNTAALTLARDSGLISTSLLEYLKDDPYVPFYRVLEEAESSIHWSTALTGQEAFKKLRGANGKLPADLMSNVLRNWAHLFSAAAKNRAARIALQEMEQAGLATKLDKPARGSVWMVDQGKPVHYQVHDEAMATAIGAMTYVMPEWQRPLAKFKGLLTYGVTALPDFKIRNLLRDTVQSLALAEQIDINPIKNLTQASKTLEVEQGLKNLVRTATGKTPKNLLPQNQSFASMLASGAVLRFGNLAEHGRSDHAENVIRRVRGNVTLDGRTGKRLLTMLGDTWTAYMEVADTTEQVNRVALYEQLRARGYDKGEAAFMARDLMDFSLTGKAPIVRFLIQTVPFLNARLQGLYRLGRAATGGDSYEAIKLNKRFANVVGSVMLLSLGLMLMYQDDEDWKEREDWDRDLYWWVKIGDTAFRFPKPFEVGAVGTLAERTWEMMFNEDMTARRFGERVSNMLLGTFALNPTPQFAKPLIDLYANRDSFTGRAIESAALEQRLSADRYTADTSMLARALGQLGIPNPLAFLNNQWSPGVNTLSPVQIDHLIGAYLGSLGVFLNRMIDGMVRPLAGEGERADRTLKQITASFVDELPAEQTRYLQAFYDRADRIGKVMATYRAAVKEGRFDDARELLAENPNAQAQDRQLQRVRRQLAELALQARRVAADEKLDGAAKRERLDQIRRRQSEIARGVEESLPAY